MPLFVRLAAHVSTKRGDIPHYYRQFQYDAQCIDDKREWNTRIVSAEQGEYTQNVVAEFEQLWDSGQSLPYEQFIKEAILKRYQKDEWDLIIIDEAHHSSSDSYRRVMDYFRPKLWLGMTATPDKRDDHFENRNIYEIFNHQIAYEIRLKDAME